MTYLELLERFFERCATGRFRRYDDGAWGHPSWRARARGAGPALRGAAGRRPSPARSRSTIDLDDPAAALARFGAGYPARRPRCCTPPTRSSSSRSATAPASRCRSCPCSTARSAAGTWPTGCGRPRTTATTPTRCSSSPAPRRSPASRAPTSRSRSCSARFEAEAIARVSDAAGAARASRRRPSGVHGTGPVAALFAAQCVVAEDGRTHPNPLWRLIAPGDTITEHDGVGDRPSVVGDDRERHARPPTATTRSSRSTPPSPTARPALRLAAAARRRRPRVTARANLMPREPSPSRRIGRVRRARRRTRLAEVGGDAARAAFAAAALGAERPPLVEDPFRGLRRRGRARHLPRAYRAATGAAHDGVPVDLALTLAWPALTALLATPGARRAASGARPRVARRHARRRAGRHARARPDTRLRGSSSSPTPSARRRGCAATPGCSRRAARSPRSRPSSRSSATPPRPASRCAAATSTISRSRWPTPTSSPPSRGCA